MQQKLLVIDLEIKRDRKKKTLYDWSKIIWGGLTPTLSREKRKKFSGMGAWSSSEDVNNIWDKTASCIRVVTEVLRALVVTKEIGG